MNKQEFKRKRYNAFCRREVQCPECHTDRTIKWRKGVKRFKVKKYRCDYCGFIGTRGQWDHWDVDEWLKEVPE
jgi:predicted RNA-binding Zn-ribbon protein involved in translation (DUF1610 family)